MRLLHYFSILMFLFSFQGFSQCFNSGDIGDFESGNLTTDFFTGDQGNGSLSVTTDEQKKGTQSLKVDVTAAGSWQVRLYNNTACNFNKSINESFTVSFYLKGDVGNIVTVSIMDNTTDDQKENVEIISADWKLYLVHFQSKTTSTKGRLKLVFTDVGTYYVDDLNLNKYDCNSTLNGSASIDDCGICSSGNTGISPINSCTYNNIDPTNPNLIYEGVLESDISSNKATFYRMKKNYVSTSVLGYYDQKRAASSSGICIRFKTSSPIIKAHFQENLILGSAVFWHTFDVFKNGEYYGKFQDLDFEISNPTGELAFWKITLPTFSTIEFINLELLTGYTVEPIADLNKPVYIAIGNSITHGQGISINSTALSYPFLVADSLNYELYNWAIGGSKVYDGILDNLSTDISPDLVSILWGYNDVHYSTGDDFLENSTFVKYETIITTFARDYPDACIMAILPTTTTNPINTSVRTIDSLKSGQLQIIQNLQKTYSNISFMHGTDYTDISSLNDAVHLNQNGNQRLANGILAELPCATITNTSNFINEHIYLYPNPTSGEINIQLNNESRMKLITLTNVHGQLIFQKKLKGQQQFRSKIEQPFGIYFLTITEESDKTSTIKIVKKQP